jgi:hypothetical protein
VKSAPRKDSPQNLPRKSGSRYQRGRLLHAKGSVYDRIRAIQAAILLPGAILATACSPNARSGTQTHQGERDWKITQQSQPVPKYRLTATIPDLMEGVIDPSADVLWDSVAYVANTQGIEDRQPRTTEEWKKVRVSAITLIEAANLLSMPGRLVDGRSGPEGLRATGASAASRSAIPVGSGELTHAEIQQRIDSTHPAFVQFARNLQDAALKALAAIDRKDPVGLMDAGGQIDEACEACHLTYWYPNQSRPGN